MKTNFKKAPKYFFSAAILFALSGKITYAALLGSEISLETIFQGSASSPIDRIGFLTTAIVMEPGVEFPSLEALEIPGAGIGTGLVDTTINVGNDFLEIDFDNVTHTVFAPALQNTYVFTFDSSVAITFTDATIDNSVTSLGLSSSDLTFSDNKLFINVEGLSFNTSTFARINLVSVGGQNAVPIPTAGWLLGSGLLGLIGIARRKKTA